MLWPACPADVTKGNNPDAWSVSVPLGVSAVLWGHITVALFLNLLKHFSKKKSIQFMIFDLFFFEGPVCKILSDLWFLDWYKLNIQSSPSDSAFHI